MERNEILAGSRMRKSLQWYEHDAVPGSDCNKTLHWKRYSGRLHERKTWNLISKD